MSQNCRYGFLSLTLLSLSSTAFSQEPRSFEYAAKFVCGTSRGEVVAPGQYFTAINVHNPAREAIEVRKRFSIALPSERPGAVSDSHAAKLGPKQSFEIDCPDIIRHARTKEPFIKGFAILESNQEIEIVVVYTAAGASKAIETMDIERVPARVAAAGGCPDLVVETIPRPEWDDANKRSVINAVIRNVGVAAAGPSTARVVDPSTAQPSGAPQNAVAATPALPPEASAVVTFYLDYWVYNPDAALDVTADYKNDLTECNETNNSKHFEEGG